MTRERDVKGKCRSTSGDERMEQILAKLRRDGFRITGQRRLLVEIILSGECSCCKEIYYKAVRQDPTIGIATVYRMVKLLEETGAIDRKNLFRISCGQECSLKGGCILVLDNEERVKLSGEDFREALNDVLRKKGYSKQDRVQTLIWDQP